MKITENIRVGDRGATLIEPKAGWRKKTDNRGVTLIELMVALAVLAMLMTAVIMMMSNNTVIYRKTKADINVSTTAQETFSALQDSIMQAKEMTIKGYTSENPGTVLTYALDPDDLADEEEDDVDGDGLIDFSKLKKSEGYVKLFPTQITIRYSMRGTTGIEKFDCWVNYYFVRYSQKLNMGDAEETPRCDIYVSHTYAPGSGRSDDVWSGSNPTADTRDNFKDWLMTSSLSEAALTAEPETQSINLDLEFNDKSQKYNTSGIVSVKNSYVMKSYLGRNNETTTEEATTEGTSEE